MAQLSIRKTPPTSPPARRRVPDRLFDLLSWDPFGEIAPIVWPEERPMFAPAFEVKESPEGFVFTADVPGVKEKDIDVTLTGNRLTVSGKREEEKRSDSDTYYTYERTYGSFSRTFTLPDGVDADHMSASLREGVLTIAVGKKPELQPKRISVSATKT